MIKIPAMKTPPAPWDYIPWEQREDWHWQLANRLTTVEKICEVIHLTEAEKIGTAKSLNHLRMAITPSYANSMAPIDPRCPIRTRAIPTTNETEVNTDDLPAPLHEDVDPPAPGVPHRHPDQVLVLVADQCAILFPS